jgi:protein-S-isoprenylcysteine O-methyltransferase Ste14
MLFFGFFGYTNIPSYFALNSNTPISTAIILSILYFLIAVCFILFLFFGDKIKKEEDTKGNNFDNNTV